MQEKLILKTLGLIVIINHARLIKAMVINVNSIVIMSIRLNYVYDYELNESQLLSQFFNKRYIYIYILRQLKEMF